MNSILTNNFIQQNNNDMSICSNMDRFINSYSKLDNTNTSMLPYENYKKYQYNYIRIIHLIVYHGESFQLTHKIVLNYQLEDEYWYVSNDEYQIYACGQTINEARMDFDSILYETYLQNKNDDDGYLSPNALILKKKYLDLFER